MAKKSGKTVAKKKHGKKSVAARKTKKPAKAVSKPVSGSEKLKQSVYKTLRLQERVKHPIRLPSVWQISKTAAQTIWDQRGLFIGITLVYGLLNLMLVQGLATGTNVGQLKHDLGQVFTGNFGGLASGLSIFIVLVGSAGNGSSQTAGAYQLSLALIGSLAIIWALRQVLAGKYIRIRDAYYRGMYPLVPFILVLLIIGLQLIPLLIGFSLYSAVISSGIAVLVVEKIFWGLLCAALILFSIYMLSSSVFALYIVTLPDMTPIKALRSARQLVRYRRWTVLRKVLALPLVLLLIAALIMVPIILWLTPLTQWVFFFLTMFSLVGVHAYSYTLYRELLNE